MTSDDFFGPTDDEEFVDWLHWAEQIVYAILLASQRVALAIVAGGFAIAGANMVHEERGLGVTALIVAGVFGLWTALATVKGVKSRL